MGEREHLLVARIHLQWEIEHEIFHFLSSFNTQSRERDRENLVATVHLQWEVEHDIFHSLS